MSGNLFSSEWLQRRAGVSAACWSGKALQGGGSVRPCPLPPQVDVLPSVLLNHGNE